MKGAPRSPWRRPLLEETRPRRSFGGIYRSADDTRDGEVIAGVPLQAASEAVVAAVKLGYRVADTQIARGRRIARELGDAAQRAGVRSAAEPVDAAEQLLGNSIRMVLEWIEQASRDPEGPLRRLVQAEYHAIGSLLGLGPGLRSQVMRSAGDAVRAADRRDDPQPTPPASAAAPEPPSMPVRHEPGTAQRMVRVLAYECSAPRSAAVLKLKLHHQIDRDAPVLSAKIAVRDGHDELLVRTQSTHPGGVWRGAICDADGLQTGHLVIEL